MISAAASAAITAGRLSFTDVAADRRDEAGEVGVAAAGRLQVPASEGRLLGLRADHADIGGVAARQRLGDDQEIERVVVRQHDEGRARRAADRTISSGTGVSAVATPAGMPSSASARVSTTIVRSGSSDSAAASAWPTWPPPKM